MLAHILVSTGRAAPLFVQMFRRRETRYTMAILLMLAWWSGARNGFPKQKIKVINELKLELCRRHFFSVFVRRIFHKTNGLYQSLTIHQLLET